MWTEDRIAFRGGGVYFFEQDLLQLRPTLLEAPWLYVTTEGTIQEASTKGNANLTGTLLVQAASQLEALTAPSGRLTASITRW